MNLKSYPMLWTFYLPERMRISMENMREKGCAQPDGILGQHLSIDEQFWEITLFFVCLWKIWDFMDNFWNPWKASFQPSYLLWSKICLYNFRMCSELILLHSCFTLPSENDDERKNLHNQNLQNSTPFPLQKRRRKNTGISRHSHSLKKRHFQSIQYELSIQINSCFVCRTRMQWGL